MRERMLISFLNDKRRFNYRSAGVVIREGHVLVVRMDNEEFNYLPGGRVEFGETSDCALEREIKEELNCKCKVGRLLFSVENFFRLNDEQFHELGRYYEVELPDNFPFAISNQPFVTYDEGHKLVFNWVRLQDNSLAEAGLQPKWIRKELLDLPSDTLHLIENEM